MEKLDFTIASLGEPKIHSPIKLSNVFGDKMANYAFKDEYIINEIVVKPGTDISLHPKNLLERAGPREYIFFEPSNVHAAVVTCGGLCPGLNNVIRAIVMTLWYRYNVKKITGIQFGFRGFLKEHSISEPIHLTPDLVKDIHKEGGTILGSSRGFGDKVTEITDYMEKHKINMLFCLGGDGTQKGTLAISKEAKRRGMDLSVVGIPKTIDNDLSFIQRSFGFETAVSLAVDAVSTAHVEATCAVKGIGLVKVMGRDSGFIAAVTALATNDVNFVLIPEVEFSLLGENGLLNCLKDRLIKRNHAVVLVAEGAGQNFFYDENKKDLSGNKKLGDIGVFLRDKISEFFKNENIEINLKYIDPSYMIRSAPANANDAVFCARLGANAVHAGMAGKTELLISMINNKLVHVPIDVAVKKRNKIDPESSLWRDVLENTGQPLSMM